MNFKKIYIKRYVCNRNGRFNKVKLYIPIFDSVIVEFSDICKSDCVMKLQEMANS